MRSLSAWLPLACLLAGCASIPLPTTTDPLTARVGRIARRGGERVTVAVAYRDLQTGGSLSIDAGERMHPASTIKVPVMMAIFDAVDRGEMRLAEPIAVRNRFESIMDGSPYELDPAEDGEPDLYKLAGSTRTLEELIRRMIVRSSNLATNLLIERIGATRVTDLTRQLGAEDLRVLRGVEDDKAFLAGMNNVTTAGDLLVLLASLLPDAQGSPFSPASRERMLAILREQEFNDKIPAGLPPGTPVAHKTGDITGIHHDAAIVFPPGERPYILVVLTRGILDEKAADATIAEISRAVWEERR